MSKGRYDAPPKIAQESASGGDVGGAPLPGKLSPPPKRKPNNELAELRRRARTAGAQARTSVSLQVRCSVELYKALVELAEEYHQPISVIARQCLEDGTRKYREFSVPGVGFANAKRMAPVTRQIPGLLRDTPPGSLASRLRPPSVSGLVPNVDDTEEAVAGLEKYAEVLAALPMGLVLPSAPNLAETHRTPEETVTIGDNVEDTPAE
jgi:hypothetical protein